MHRSTLNMYKMVLFQMLPHSNLIKKQQALARKKRKLNKEHASHSIPAALNGNVIVDCSLQSRHHVSYFKFNIVCDEIF